MSGKLFVVATPIGNLSDITFRAIETLKSVDLIACEDTRVTIKLLNHFEIKKELISYHQHSGVSKIEKLIGLLKDGKNIAMVSDAGTPGLSDPGSQLLSACYENEIEIVTIPGPSTLTAILSVCDFPMHEFIFMGFIPQKKGRQTKIAEIVAEERPIVFFESVYRIKKVLSELEEKGINRRVLIGRELTKKFETLYHGSISEIKDKITEKGEFVVILEGKNGKK